MPRRLVFLAFCIVVVGLDLPQPFAGRVWADTPPLIDPFFTSLPGGPPDPSFFDADPLRVPGDPTSTLIAGTDGRVVFVDPITGLTTLEFDPLGPEFRDPIDFTTFSFNGGPQPDTLFAGPHGPSNVPFAGWALNPLRLLGRNEDEWIRLGGLRVDSGNFAGDVTPEIVFGSGPGGPGSVSITSLGREEQQWPFGPFGPNHPHGTSFATGDINGDGFDELAVCSEGPGAMLGIFNLRGNDVVMRGLAPAFGPDFPYGCRPELFDMNGDGFDDIIVGSGGGPSRIRIYNSRGGPATLVADFDPLGQTLDGGLFPAGLLLNGEQHLAIGGGSSLESVQITRDRPRRRLIRTLSGRRLFGVRTYTSPGRRQR